MKVFPAHFLFILISLDIQLTTLFSKRKLSAKELMLLKCSVGELSSETLGLKGDQISQS